jgi:hypothetical protein
MAEYHIPDDYTHTTQGINDNVPAHYCEVPEDFNMTPEERFQQDGWNIHTPTEETQPTTQDLYSDLNDNLQDIGDGVAEAGRRRDEAEEIENLHNAELDNRNRPSFSDVPENTDIGNEEIAEDLNNIEPAEMPVDTPEPAPEISEPPMADTSMDIGIGE